MAARILETGEGHRRGRAEGAAGDPGGDRSAASTAWLQRPGGARTLQRNRVRRGGITKTGNSHLRRVLVEAAWAYPHRPNVTGFLLRRQKNLALSDEVKKIAWKAQQRLHKRYQAFAARDKNKNQIVTALGRELLGFIWAIAAHIERQQKPLIGKTV